MAPGDIGVEVCISAGPLNGTSLQMKALNPDGVDDFIIYADREKANRMDSCVKYQSVIARTSRLGKGLDFALAFKASVQMTGTESALIYQTPS